MYPVHVRVLPWYLAGVQPWDSWGLYKTYKYSRAIGLLISFGKVSATVSCQIGLDLMSQKIWLNPFFFSTKDRFTILLPSEVPGSFFPFFDFPGN